MSAGEVWTRAPVRDSGDGGTTVAVGGSDPIELPAGALKTLHKLVHGLAAGNDPMLTTTEAADFLGVSRPHVTKLIKTGQLAYRKKGNRHLVPTSAVQRFKAERDEHGQRDCSTYERGVQQHRGRVHRRPRATPGRTRGCQHGRQP
jgi:excisionase family DNA binding protein